MSKFTGPIVVKLLKSNFWQLMQDLEYHVGTYPSNEIIKVPLGFQTDFASVPRIFWSILPPVGKYAKAAVVHDFVCYYRLYNRKRCDEIFLEAMRVSNVTRFTRYIMYYAVRIFGWFAWQYGRNYINDRINPPRDIILNTK